MIKDTLMIFSIILSILYSLFIFIPLFRLFKEGFKGILLAIISSILYGFFSYFLTSIIPETYTVINILLLLFIAFIITPSLHKKYLKNTKQKNINNINNTIKEKNKIILYNLFLNVMYAYSSKDLEKIKLIGSTQLINEYTNKINSDNVDIYRDFRLNSFTIIDQREIASRFEVRVDIDVTYLKNESKDIKTSVFRVKYTTSNKVIDYKCPNCGAPISNIETTKCEYCNKSIDIFDEKFYVDSITEITVS